MNQLSGLDDAILEVAELDGNSLVKRYDPDIPEDVREQIRGTSLIDVLKRGAQSC
jgi:hypothetical protein